VDQAQKVLGRGRIGEEAEEVEEVEEEQEEEEQDGSTLHGP
jgi:hypothetical protein